jgi:PAS domain S-box-containing protein
MLEALGRFFSEDDFMPHGMCYLWQPSVLWLHVVSDALIVAAYFSIPFTLLYFVHKRKDLKFHWVFVCFAIFIVACGTTHLMEIWVIWHPAYWLSGSIKAITALASVPTAIMLVRLVPEAVRLPSPAKLEAANIELQREVADRKRAEGEARRLNEELESRVAERTRQLELANRTLHDEARERERAQAELHESESRVRAVLDSTLDAVVVMSAEGRIVDWNAQAEAIFGWTREQAIGRELAETIVPEHLREGHRQGLRHFLASGEGPVLNRRLELAALRRDGSEFPVELRVNAIKGTATSFCGFVIDLTERKRVEEAARSAQALLQAIVDNSTAVVYVKDVEGRYLLINRRYEELFHHTRESILGKTDYDVFPSEAADAFRAVDQRVQAAGRPLQIEEIAPHDDGLHTYISIKCPLYDGSDKVYAVCGISTDITERNQSERRQRQQLSQLELLNRITRAIEERQDLLSILQVVLRSLEEDLPTDFGCICTYDRASESLTVARIGSKSEALGAEMMLTENVRLAIDQNGLSRCVRGELVLEADTRASPFPFPQRLARAGLHAAVIAPLVVAGDTFGVMVIARRAADSFSSGDCEFLRQLSEHVALAAHQAQLYGDLQRAYDDLRQTQLTIMQQERLRALGQMASGVAHDINNALSPAALYAQSLLEFEQDLSPRVRERLETIQQAVEDVAQTVDRLREFHRPRDPQSASSAVHIDRVIAQVVNLTRARWLDMPQEQGAVIDVQVSVAADLPPIVGSEGEFRDALTNLVLNAVDAMPEGGTLTLRAQPVADQHDGEAIDAQARTPAQICVEISDTGVGMDEDTRRKCVEPFFTTKGERGSGLGLAMVYGTVQRHSGQIEIDSEPGRGTTIKLLFPVYLAGSAASLGPASASRPLRGLRILVVDDDPLLLRSMRDTLETDGHEVVVADSGQSGIDAFADANRQGQPFDVIFSDLGMPYLDGRKVAAAIKALSPRTPVVLVTGWGQRMQAENDMPPYVDWVLSKPPKIGELRKALADLTCSA